LFTIMKLKKLIISSAAVIGGAGMLLTGCGSKTTANVNVKTEAQPVDVSTVQAVVKPIPTYFEATGTLGSDESTDVAPSVAGKILQVNFDVGSYVNKGDVLVRLDARDAQLRLEQAQAQVQQQQRAVETAIAGQRQAEARLGVNPGQAFNTEAFSQVKTVKANLQLAEQELARSERLLESGDVSRSTVDQRRAQRDALVGQLDEARSNAAVSVKAITSAETQVGAARAGVTSAQTQVDAARKAITDTAIYAPISGFVSDRVADPGEYISPSAPNAKIATIVRTSTLRLRIDVPEASIGKVSVGQGITLQTTAYPDRNFTGTVARLLPSLNATARTLTVEAQVANSDGLLKPGQFATVRITQPTPENAVMIPASAVKAEGDTSKVFVIKDGAAREHIVQLGLLENDLIQIKSGIAEGDLVATGNINALTDGVLVRQTN
jgi:RND family efflux transporter MFP subunit